MGEQREADGAEGGGIGLARHQHDQQELRAAGQHLVDQRAAGPPQHPGGARRPRPVAGCRPGSEGGVRHPGRQTPPGRSSGSFWVGRLGASNVGSRLALRSALHRTSAAPPAVAANPAARVGRGWPRSGNARRGRAVARPVAVTPRMRGPCPPGCRDRGTGRLGRWTRHRLGVRRIHCDDHRHCEGGRARDRGLAQEVSSAAQGRRRPSPVPLCLSPLPRQCI